MNAQVNPNNHQVLVNLDDLRRLVEFNKGFEHVIEDVYVLFSMISKLTEKHDEDHVLAGIGQNLTNKWGDYCTEESGLLDRLQAVCLHGERLAA